MPVANILIEGTTLDSDGLYEMAPIESGKYTIAYSFLGYKTVEIPNGEVVAGKVTIINIPMAANEGVALDRG